MHKHNPSDEQAAAMVYPCDMPIKVLGKSQPNFAQEIAEVMQEFDPEFDAATVEMRPSRKGNYMGLTLVITAQSREHLDDIYQRLHGHPMVSFVL